MCVWRDREGSSDGIRDGRIQSNGQTVTLEENHCAFDQLHLVSAGGLEEEEKIFSEDAIARGQR